MLAMLKVMIPWTEMQACDVNADDGRDGCRYQWS